MDIPLIVNGFDVSSRLSTYRVDHEVTYKRVVTTMDDTEHALPSKIRPIITFSLLPGTEEEDAAFYNAVSSLEFYATFLDKGRSVTQKVRVTSSLTERFLLTSFDGKRRYRGGDIQLRGK